MATVTVSTTTQVCLITRVAKTVSESESEVHRALLQSTIVTNSDLLHVFCIREQNALMIHTDRLLLQPRFSGSHEIAGVRLLAFVFAL